MNSRIVNSLVVADRVLDYVPLISTGTNLINLFQKKVFIPQVSPEKIASNHYYTHISEKSVGRCLTLLIPGLGNLLVLISDFLSDKNWIIKNIKDGWSILYPLASKELKEDREVAIAAAIQGSSFVPSRFYQDKEVVLATIEGGNPNILGKTPFTDDEDVVYKAVEKSGGLLKDASDRLKNNLNIATKAIQNDPSTVRYLSHRLKGNEEIASLVLEQNGELLKFFSRSIRGNKKIVEIAVTNRGDALAFAEDPIKNSKEIVITSLKTFKDAFYLASARLQKDPDVIKAFLS